MNDTLYLSLTGKLWVVFRELLKEKWPPYIESALYYHISHWQMSSWNFHLIQLFLTNYNFCFSFHSHLNSHVERVSTLGPPYPCNIGEDMQPGLVNNDKELSNSDALWNTNYHVVCVGSCLLESCYFTRNLWSKQFGWHGYVSRFIQTRCYKLYQSTPYHIIKSQTLYIYLYMTFLNYSSYAMDHAYHCE